MRDISDCLNELGILAASEFADEDSQEDRTRERENKVRDRNSYSIRERSLEIIILEKVLEMLETDKFRAEESESGLIILECNDKTEHRSILEDDVIEKNRDEEEIEGFILRPILLHFECEWHVLIILQLFLFHTDRLFRFVVCITLKAEKIDKINTQCVRFLH